MAIYSWALCVYIVELWDIGIGIFDKIPVAWHKNVLQLAAGGLGVASSIPAWYTILFPVSYMRFPLLVHQIYPHLQKYYLN